MTNLQTVREAVIKAVPEIVSLQFGCAIEHSDERATIIRLYENHPFMFSAVIARTDGYPKNADGLPKDEVTVIGRPIRLADVLLAVGEAAREVSYFVDSDGNFHEWFAPKGRLDLRTIAHWNLREDDLSKQSEETIEFLASLLK